MKKMRRILQHIQKDTCFLFGGSDFFMQKKVESIAGIKHATIGKDKGKGSESSLHYATTTTKGQYFPSKDHFYALRGKNAELMINGQIILRFTYTILGNKKFPLFLAKNYTFIYFCYFLC